MIACRRWDTSPRSAAALFDALNRTSKAALVAWDPDRSGDRRRSSRLCFGVGAPPVASTAPHRAMWIRRSAVCRRGSGFLGRRGYGDRGRCAACCAGARRSSGFVDSATNLARRSRATTGPFAVVGVVGDRMMHRRGSRSGVDSVRCRAMMYRTAASAAHGWCTRCAADRAGSDGATPCCAVDRGPAATEVLPRRGGPAGTAVRLVRPPCSARLPACRPARVMRSDIPVPGSLDTSWLRSSLAESPAHARRASASPDHHHLRADHQAYLDAHGSPLTVTAIAWPGDLHPLVAVATAAWAGLALRAPLPGRGARRPTPCDAARCPRDHPLRCSARASARDAWRELAAALT